MEVDWWEALLMFILFAAQFVFPRHLITIAFFLWVAVELIRVLAARRIPAALASFIETWRTAVMQQPERPARLTKE
jgi:hypothetical protein